MSQDYTTIELSKTGKHAGRYVAFVDIVDSDLADHNWVFTHGKRTQYVKRWTGGRKNKKSLYLHRVVMERILGRSLEKHEQVDHINGVGTDNRRFNLRLALPSENGHNRGQNRNNSSGFKGVFKSKKKWEARIMSNRVTYKLGIFDTPEEAHAAYCEAADTLHKKFKNYG